MLRTTGFRALVLVLALMVAAAPAAMAVDHSPQVKDGFGKALGTLWQALASIFASPAYLVDRPPVSAGASSCGESGSIMDPNGCPHAAVSGTHSDSGSIMDPNG
jgi:hypothetical protein